MTTQRTPSEILRSITGGLLVGLGLHILSGNVDRVAIRLSQSLGINTGEALGLLPSAVLAVSHAAELLAVDHVGTLQSVLRDAGAIMAAASRDRWSEVVARCFHG